MHTYVDNLITHSCHTLTYQLVSFSKTQPFYSVASVLPWTEVTRYFRPGLLAARYYFKKDVRD